MKLNKHKLTKYIFIFFIVLTTNIINKTHPARSGGNHNPLPVFDPLICTVEEEIFFDGRGVSFISPIFFDGLMPSFSSSGGNPKIELSAFAISIPLLKRFVRSFSIAFKMISSISFGMLLFSSLGLGGESFNILSAILQKSLPLKGVVPVSIS